MVNMNTLFLAASFDRNCSSIKFGSI